MSDPAATNPDPLGRGLEIVIRVARDGRVYFQDIPLDILPVARTLCPDDPDLARRAAIAEAVREGLAALDPHSEKSP